jgi:tRNA nucleotidyltransferase (CCA-adding enzyme)
VDVIVTHANTDFDALASLVAARRLYPGSVACLVGSLNANVREFVRLHAEELDLVEPSRLDLESITRLVAVDTVDASRLGDFERVARDPTVEVVVFDHHAAGSVELSAAGENTVVSTDGALATTMASILAEREIPVSPLEATLIALGIHEDTGSLTYPSTTLRDVEALGWCLRHGAQQSMVAHYLHAPLAAEERALLDALVSRLEAHAAGGVDVLVSAVRWPRYVDGVSNLTHKVVDLTDAPAVACLVEMEDRVVCVVRARVPELDASAVAAALGGGGHEEAASATFRGQLAEARRLVLAALPDAVRGPFTAGEIMSRPARFVAPDETVARAMVLCQRHRQSGIQVGSPRELVGVVAREDLDKAVAHGLSHAPVKSVMTTSVATCDEATPVGELRRLVATSSAGRVPVVRDAEVVGVVTRSDVLTALGELAGEPEAPTADLRERLLDHEELRGLFEAVQAVSGSLDGVYLVGGAVRDLLTGEPTFDIDVAVEGDGIAFGQALARELGGRAVAHAKFGTAIVVYGDRRRVDVATTRTEFYDAPGSLPHVEQATIRQDLLRRDFTINAMAVSLRGEDFGRLVDYFGGLRDLEDGVLRVLHNLSFIDDPTRIFRAIRYENRYGFRMERQTLALARACVEMGLVGELSSARLRDELQLLLDEDRIGDAVLRLADLGVDHAIHPHLAADEEAVRLTDVVDDLRARYAPREPAWRLRLAVLARRLPPDELYEWFDRLKLRRRDAERIADAVTVAPRLRDRLARTDDPATIRSIAQPHDPGGVLLALAEAEGDARRRLVRYLEELRDVELEISGADLADLGLGESPRVGEILDELLRRKLNGELDGRSAELAAARELLQAARQ